MTPDEMTALHYAYSSKHGATGHHTSRVVAEAECVRRVALGDTECSVRVSMVEPAEARSFARCTDLGG